MRGPSSVVLFVRSVAGATALFALSALLSWTVGEVGVTSIGLGTARTSVATALCLLAASADLLVLSAGRIAPGPRKAISFGFAGAVFAAAIYALATYAAGTPEAGYLLGPALGRMSPATALGLEVLAAALLATAARFDRLRLALAVVGLMLCMTGLVGFALDVKAVQGIFLFSSMSFPTLAALTLLSLAVLALDSDRGWMRQLGFRGPVGLTFWLLMPVSIILPVSLAVGVHHAVESNFVALAFALAVLAVSMTFIFGAIVVAACFWLARGERSQARLVAIVQSSDDAIISKTPEGVITSWNRGAERLFGYSAKEAVGRTMHIVIPEERADEEEQILSRIRKGEHVEHFETVRRHKDGRELDISVTVSPVRLGSGEIAGASSIMRDIGPAKRREEELRRSNAELEQFAYIASHDLQEPLRMVANYTELLATRYRGQLDERADKYIHYATDGARRMQQLVVDLLAYSRVGSQGKPLEPVALQDVLARATRNLEGPVERTGAKVEWGELPAVDGDEVQLDQLFQNLIGNAIKFRGEGAPHIEVSAVRDGRFWLVTVRDNGIGMEMKHAERIFQMFQRLHGRGDYEGSGIGLAIAKRIVERHGGRIWAESAPGEGTAMRFTLPATG